MSVLIRGIVIGMKLAGLSHSKVVEKLSEHHLGGSLGFVSKIWSKWTSGECMESPYVNCGRKPILINDAILLKTIDKFPRITLKELQSHTEINPSNVSRMTIKRKMNLMNINAKKVVKKFLISQANISNRLDWCKAHRQWGQKEWDKVWFSDESKLFAKKSGHSYFWRRQHRNKAPETEETSMFHNGFEILVWGYITSEEVGRLIRIDGRLDGHEYLNMVKKNLNIKMMKSNGFIWQQDNAPCHNLSRNWLEEKGVEVLPWPAQSPDLNPIEHVWAVLKHELWIKRNQITSQDDVWEISKKVWYGKKVELMVPRLYEKYRERLKEIIRKKGGHSTY